MQPATATSRPALAPVEPPELTDAERGRLQTASDGTDHRESAFEALVEHVNTWPRVDRPSLFLPDPELELLLNQPSLHRGRAFRVRGRLEQKSMLKPPYASVAEWFVRDRFGRPVIVYVCGTFDPAGFEIGAMVEVPGRYYKRVDAEAQDGRKHSYAAFVGTQPLRIGGMSYLAGPLRMMAGVVAALLVVYVGVVWWSRRARSQRERRTSILESAPRDLHPPSDAINASGDPPEPSA
jgi:hypothetical protein